MSGADPRAIWAVAATLLGTLLPQGWQTTALARRPAPGVRAAGATLDSRETLAPGGPRHMVLVELFTSQGCSSCPPADQLIAQIGEETPGAVVPLSFHVDYWNNGGWTDPFSQKDWSARQVYYAKALGLGDRIYTPQAVVDGRKELVGSDERSLRGAIAQAQARPAGTISIHLEPPKQLKVAVTANIDLPDSLRDRRLDLMLAEFEMGLVTSVGKGENGGRTLHNEYVVRQLERCAKLAAGGPARTENSGTMTLEKDWNQRRLGIAAFLQDPKTLEIYGATSQVLASSPRN
ncbi:MAG TPA: DUF1223 domain-containing protein [Thermoanaerobaculia bacterium]